MVTSITPVLIVVAIVLLAKALGWGAQKIGQPAVLGELLTGLLLGGSVLGVLDPEAPVIAMLAEVGLLVLLFEIGLHTDIKALLRVGRAAITVGIVGVIAPFLLGWLTGTLFHLSATQAIVCGAALTATSIGISARVLQDLGVIASTEGQIVLGAAVFDDVAGLAILAMVSSIAAAQAGSSATDSGGSILHSITMLGSFAAGMIIHRTRLRVGGERIASTLGFVVVPVFFAAVGAAVQLKAVAGVRALLLFATLLVVGVLGKYIAGYAPRRFTGNRALIGWAMVPRGEVGLVFATTAFTTGIFDETLFSVVTLVVMATTFLAPPVLTRVALRQTQEE